MIDRVIKLMKSSKKSSKELIHNESRIIALVSSNSFFNSTCLEKSLFSYFLFGLYSIDCVLKFGVNNSLNNFMAHAWLEYNGEIINDSINNIREFKILSSKL